MLNVLFFSRKKRLVLLAFFYAAFLSACSSDSAWQVYEFSGPTMGTQYNIKIVGDKLEGSVEREELSQLITQSLDEINQSMSTYITDSELSLFNLSPEQKWFSVSPMLCDVLLAAQDVSIKSQGAFDVTVGPLVNMWGFGPSKTQNLPSKEQIERTLAQVGYEALELDCASGRIKKHKAIYVDLSAIAKGYAADFVAQKLVQAGILNAMVEIGGELRVKGKNANQVNWQIAIEKPALIRGSAMQVLSVSEVGVATSGEYRNYYERDGRRVSHTVDPKTGEPISHKLASVTVVASTSGLADAWATALNVLGPERGFALAEQHQLAAFFILRAEDDFVVNYTPRFEDYMVTP